MGSLAFYEYFQNVILRQFPQYGISPEDMSRMMSVKIITLANSPSVIEIKCTCPNKQEAFSGRKHASGL